MTTVILRASRPVGSGCAMLLKILVNMLDNEVLSAIIK